MDVPKELNYAIVGASNDTSKYGYIVMKDLMESGYDVVPINPRGGSILGMQVYTALEFYDGDIDVVVIIVPPAVTERIVEQCAKLKIKKVWMQPGAESTKAVEFCERNGIECVHGKCIMVARRTG